MSRASIFSEDDPKHSPEHRHEVQFYESHAFLNSAVARYLAGGFRHGNAMVVIARPEHCAAFRHELERQGLDVQGAIRSGQFREFDAEELLSRFMDTEIPNRDRFHSVIGNVIDESRKRNGIDHDWEFPYP